MIKYGSTIFDDWVPKTEHNSAWSYLCEDHLNHVLKNDPSIYYAGASAHHAICGVFNCQVEADYEIDFLNEDKIILLEGGTKCTKE